MRARSAHQAVDTFSRTHGTVHVAGHADPPQAWRAFAELQPGTRLTLHVSDFDRRLAFEAIVRVEGAAPTMLVYARGTVGAASPEQAEMVAAALGARGLAPDRGEGEYLDRLALLRARVEEDPAAGLEALGAERGALFDSHVADIARRAMAHARAGTGVVEWIADRCLGRAPAEGPLRGFLLSGGARRLLEDAVRHRACGRALARRVALEALEARIDRELVVLACLKRGEATAEDLLAVLEAATARLETSAERRRIAVEVARHPSADGGVLRGVVERVGRLGHSADRREALVAVAGRGDGRLLVAVARAAAREVEFDSDRERVFLAVLDGSRAEEVRAAVREGAAGLEHPACRARVQERLK